MFKIETSFNLPSLQRSALNRLPVKEQRQWHESSEKRAALAFEITKLTNRYMPGTNVISSSFEL